MHIPTAISQEVKAICVSREALIKTRTQLIGRVPVGCVGDRFV
jgi:hypothetical protein